MVGPTVEELLAHHEFVRSIARRLSLDDSGADDLVQRTWLTALERPPRQAGSLRTWLARVVRNLALNSRREARRRARRERHAARPETAPDPRAAFERAARDRRVARAVLALDEPYRVVVLRRFYAGASNREIARTLGLSETAVRKRLRRAFAQLRDELRPRPGTGDFGPWRLGLPFESPAPPCGST